MVPPLDQVQFWRPQAWPGIELMSAHWVRHSFAKHFHDSYTVGINDHGWSTFDCRGNTNQAIPGTVNLLAPGETHTGRAAAADGWLYRDFYIDPECMTGFAAQVGINGALEFKSAVVEDEDLVRLFRRAFELIVGEPSSLLEQEYHLLLAIRRLCGRHTSLALRIEPASTGKNGKITGICDYLHAHFDTTVSINDLARLVGWSGYHLIRDFHRQTGLPPHAYQNALRVNAARRLLRGGASIADAAASCGFCDQSHMHRTFRRIAGATPGQYTRKVAISSKI
jgi:AraC-like DNA-binding protein